MILSTSKVTRSIFAGVVATVVMTVLMSAGKALGVHTWDIATMLGSAIAFGRTVTSPEPLWILGLIVHFITGMCVFPLIYSHWLWGWLRGPNWLRGICWGFFLWFVTQGLFMPLVGEGFFALDSSDPASEVFSWLFLLGVYGVIFGLLAGPQSIRRLEVQDHPEWVAH